MYEIDLPYGSLISRFTIRFMFTRQNLHYFSIAIASLMGASLSAADLTNEQKLDFFRKEVEPILQNNCLKCHSGEEPKGELLLTTREGLEAGGESGEVVSTEEPEESLLLNAVNYVDYEMPPKGKMPQKNIDVLTKWVKLGAPFPDGELKSAHGEEKGPPRVNEENKRHWSFRPLVRPSVPEIAGVASTTNAIDAFIAARRGEAGLNANPPADKVTLIRRAYYDLIGLPPTTAQVEAFVKDDSPNAFEKVIDQLLENPQYGERWARHWLDLVRYAETNSFERDNPKPYVWKYRDYVIRAFNEDKPYDRFVREQLAGDELADATPDSIVATGYYRLGAWDDEPADPELARFDELDDIAAVTGQTFLGLTVNCARCHDHKLDPIPQKDYYQLISFFRNIRRYGARSDQSVRDASIGPVEPGEQGAAKAKAAQQYNAKVSQVNRDIANIERTSREKLQGVAKDDFNSDAYRVRILKQHVGKVISQQKLDRYISLRKEREELAANQPKEVELALLVKEPGANAPETHVLIRGNPHAKGDVVQPAFLSILSPPDPNIEPTQNGTSGRRLALANWIADKSNPLTARVMANRLWHYHFGRGIVRSTNNLGLQGDKPTHPELIDWLASELIAGGWKMKRMHKLIMLSNTYRMASTPSKAELAADPVNNYYWRFNMRRLEAEEVRDSILAVNGSLNAKMFGPSIYPTIPPEVLHGQSRPGAGWKTSPPEEQRRRSVYIHIKRSLPVPIIKSFDGADTDQPCPVRFSTTQPTQALGMLNSTFLMEQAKVFAETLKKEAGAEPAEQVAAALRRVTQRQPTNAEIERGVRLMKDLQTEYKVSNDDALKYYCLTALNLNEFIFLD